MAIYSVALLKQYQRTTREHTSFANEVRNLSGHSRQLNDKIRNQINSVKLILDEANDVVGEIASIDMKNPLESKGNMDKTTEVLNKSKTYIEQVVNNSADLATTIRDDVSSAITALQNEDIAAQLAYHIKRRYDNILKLLNELVIDSAGIEDVSILVEKTHDALQQANLRTADNLNKPVAATSMASGDAELFQE